MEARPIDSDTLTLLDLPDELLRLCIERLSLLERRKALPLVCRRMQRLVAAPSLNTQVDLSFGDAATTHSRLQSLCTWLLAGAAEHVQQLCIDLPDDFLDDDDRTDVVCLLSSVLTACGILGSLRELRLLHGAMYFPCAGWVGTLRHLRRLHISSEHYSPLPASLHILCELEQLSLEFSSVEAYRLPPAVRLPPSITSLYLGEEGSGTLPKQVASLTRLHSLSLKRVFYPSDSYTPLLNLTTLRRLAITNCTSLPACLPELTWLVALSIDDPADALYEAEADESGALVRAALPQLTCLTHLALDDFADLMRPPPELTCLTRLASFCWIGHRNPATTQALPPGSYLAGVAHLLAPVDVLFNSLPALGAARSLERISTVLRRSGGSSEVASWQLSAVLQWAVRQPTLRVLMLQADKELLGTAFFDAVRLLQRNPGIRLEPSSTLLDPDCLRELCLGTA